MARIIPQPMNLCALAKRADETGEVVALTPDEARGIADMWHSDRERVRYLESLIVKIARGVAPAVQAMHFRIDAERVDVCGTLATSLTNHEHPTT